MTDNPEQKSGSAVKSPYSPPLFEESEELRRLWRSGFRVGLAIKLFGYSAILYVFAFSLLVGGTAMSNYIKEHRLFDIYYVAVAAFILASIAFLGFFVGEDSKHH